MQTIEEEIKNSKENIDEYEFVIPITNFMKLKPFVDRYFIKYYIKYHDQSSRCLDQFIFLHTNKLLMLGLSSKHYVVKEKIKISRINFVAFHGEDLTSLVHGKKKRGGVRLTDGKILCELELENGEKIPVKSPLQGTIIEINDALFENPNILLTHPESKGFLFMVNSFHKYVTSQAEKWISNEAYNEEGKLQAMLIN